MNEKSNEIAAKRQARDAAKVSRAKAFARLHGAGRALARAVLAHGAGIGLAAGPKIVSAFWPMGSEIDTKPMLDALHRAGHTLALPVALGPKTPLVFRRWTPGGLLLDGGFGTSVPPPDAPEVVPEVLFVPLLSYDDAGYRLGYGGGFYDRTLAKLRREGSPVAVGVAFSAQRVDMVPRGPHDQPLDWIATEKGARRCGAVKDRTTEKAL